MNIKRIGALCKRLKTCVLYDLVAETGELTGQWISCGRAMWPVSGLPELRGNNLSTLFDFTPAQSKEMDIREEEMPYVMESILYDYRETEPVLQESFLRIRCNGAELMALTTAGRTTWIDTELLKPCWGQVPRLALRKFGDGDEAVAVIDGLWLVGIALPSIMTADAYRELTRLGVSGQTNLGENHAD